MREIKFRAWDKDKYVYFDLYGTDGTWHPNADDPLEVKNTEQYTGLKDKNGKEYYIGDKGQFENGDTFVLKMEDWLEVYVEWIGEPECEDQARDLYRIGRAEIIGNIHVQ